jgi:hypothetical protein
VESSIDVALGSEAPLDGLPSTILVPHALHFIRQSSELVIQLSSHFIELAASLPQGETPAQRAAAGA